MLLPVSWTNEAFVFRRVCDGSKLNFAPNLPRCDGSKGEAEGVLLMVLPVLTFQLSLPIRTHPKPLLRSNFSLPYLMRTLMSRKKNHSLVYISRVWFGP